MKQYLLAVYPSYDEIAQAEPEEIEKMFAQVEVFNTKLREQGAWVFAGGLEPPETATVVRNEAGATTTTPGPYAQASVQIGGFWIIAATDLDAATAWAKEGSVACGADVEVRPFQDEPEG